MIDESMLLKFVTVAMRFMLVQKWWGAARVFTTFESRDVMLLSLIQNFDATTMTHVAKMFELTNSSAAEWVKKHEAAGRVVIETSPSDKRCKVLKLTKQGEEKLEELSIAWYGNQYLELAFAELSDDEIATFFNLFEKMKKGVDKGFDHTYGRKLGII